MMDHRLELFIKAAEKGSFTSVAEELYISQPAVSKAINSLEKELNIRLFYRDRRNGLSLTEAGERILILARQTADIDQRIYQESYRVNHRMGGKLRIGSLPILTTTMLSRIIPEYRKKYPDVSLEIHEGSPRDLKNALNRHEIDVALSCSPFDEFDHEVLVHDQMVGIYASNLIDPPKQIDLYEGKPNLIAVRAAVETISESLRSAARPDFSNYMLLEDYITVIRMVEHGNGVGIISKYTLDSVQHNLKTCELIPEILIDIGVEAIDLNDLTPAAEAFVALLKDLSFVT